jgi:cytoskeletal protein CcmA (bactofilin family)
MPNTLSVGGPLVISGTESNTACITFSRVNANYILAPSGGSIYLNVSGDISSASSALKVTSTAITKGSSLTINLGESANPWSAVYGVVGNFSGTLSVSGKTTILNDLVVTGDAHFTGLITADSGIKIGDATITWDASANALKIDGNVYATGKIGAKN